MLYCEKCKRVFDDDRETCPDCGSSDVKVPESHDYTLLNKADAHTANELGERLKAQNLPFLIEEIEAPGLSDKQATGKAAAVYVKLKDRQAAEECAGALKTEMAENTEEFEDMPPLKRSFVKLVSGILFLILVAVVVIGSDYIIEWFMGLFKG